MEKIKFNLINMLLLLTLVSFTACKQDDDNVPGGEKSLVTIRTYLSAPVGTIPTRAGTRAAEVLPKDEKHYKDPNTTKENKVSSVRVFACLGDKVVKNILYVRSLVSYTASPGETVKEFKSGGDERSILMDIELFPNTYTFILVANESSLYTPGATSVPINFSNITTKSQVEKIMVAPSTITSNNDLDKTDYAGIPMVGEQQITVPRGQYDADHKWLATPAINLERTLAKVEFYVKNTDENDKVYPENQFYQFLKVWLENANPCYYLLNEDKSSCKDLSTLDLTYNPFSSLLPGTYFNNFRKKNETGKYNNGYANGNDYQQEITWYMSPRVGVDETNATTIVLSTKVGEETTQYKIPLYQTLSGVKNYDMKRNTIYRIYATLKGKVLECRVFVWVKGWESMPLQPVVIQDDDLKTE